MLKWHRGRRLITDAVFTRSRIAEGMRLGASIEVDIQRHGSNGFVILHDETLDRETSGSGPVATQKVHRLRQLRMRDNNGTVTSEPVLLLDDLAGLLAGGPIDDSSVLQLDLKNDRASLSSDDIAAFPSAVEPFLANVLVSGDDADAVDSLRRATPGLRTGYDPCREDTIAELRRTGDFAAFVHAALVAAPDAEMVYVHHRIVLAADTAGFDMIGAIQAAGKRVDAWTIEQVNDETLAMARRLLALKVDQITTDDPVGLEAALSNG
ncbi:MAG: glycerophosphodiester phosphodiesterase family protein [Pseudomonadota bacterium]